MQVRDVLAVPGAERAVVTVSDGSLKLIELADGSAVVSNSWQPGAQLSLQPAGEDAFLVHERGGEAQLVAYQDLEILARTDVPSGAMPWSVGPGGCLVLRTAEGLLLRDLLRADVSDRTLPAANVRGVAWSPNTELLAAAHDGGIGVWLRATGESVAQLSLDGVAGQSTVAFLDEERLCVGWGTADMEAIDFGVDVLQVATGARIARLEPKAFAPFGASTRALSVLHGPGLVLFSTSSMGAVYAYELETWARRWSWDSGGGNPGALVPRHARDSERVLVSGMTSSHSRVMDVETGEALASTQVEGCFELQETDSGQFVVAQRGGALAVFDGKTLAPIYDRREAAGGGAWIESAAGAVRREGQLNAQRHLARAGWSAPEDCWEAWLRDPLALGPAARPPLPNPPRITAGPARFEVSEGPSVQLGLTAEDPAGLLGVEVVVDGDAPRFVPVTADGALAAQVSGPWPRDVTLRAVARTGVRSPPWRVRVLAE